MTLPVVATRGTTFLPGMVNSIEIGRTISIRAIEQAMGTGSHVLLVMQPDGNLEIPTEDDLCRVGLVAEIKQVIQKSENHFKLLFRGVGRAELLALTNLGDYFVAEVAEKDDYLEEDLPKEALTAMAEGIKDSFFKFAQADESVGEEKKKQIKQLQNLPELLDYIGNSILITMEQRQQILEAISLTERYEIVLLILMEKTEVAILRHDLRKQVVSSMEKRQNEHIIREEIGILQRRLGNDNPEEDVRKMEEAIDALEARDEVKARLHKELRRLKRLSESSSESSVSQDYIETLLDLPWDKRSADHKDLAAAREILDAEHYGMKEVKERVLEYLAVRNLTDQTGAPILCLVGPPGCGKTSIAQSLAKAVGKEYVRICLGGVRDEAEIRGHRKTYIGSMPGRIIEGLRKAKVGNPFMLLDEVDKMSSDYKGDPTSALLEVLDSAQNSHFRDHYVELTVDLSEVLFVATANDRGAIPKPLLDRMEIIEVPGYTDNEKFHIAKRHLIPKQMKENGLVSAKHNLRFTDKAIEALISGYTREAGVRELERKIGTVCRKVAREVFEARENAGFAVTNSISGKNLADYLGPVKYLPDKKNKKPEIGIVRGLAWTAMGGVTLEIEVNTYPGKGQLLLTGQLGDVMKESAQAALTYVRSVAKDYGVASDFFEEHDIHIHIPEGATPKDGPSAGVTMTTAILSAVSEIPVRTDIAMTGEVTLRGRVLPIGGLKEKLLAAKQAGMTTVCIPKDNWNSYLDLDDEITEGLDVIATEYVSENIAHAFVKK